MEGYIFGGVAAAFILGSNPVGWAALAAIAIIGISTAAGGYLGEKIGKTYGSEISKHIKLEF
ncbi:MAG: hypothetical protein IPO48_05915 [Saprospiraceae bacterium]|nr:hypothetical protein [Saprospiraceae bacterium]